MNTKQETTDKNRARLKDLKAKLRELFQLDRGDLDFGLYRIMKHKSEEVHSFLENRLFPEINETLGDISAANREHARKTLSAARQLAVQHLGLSDDEADDLNRIKKLKNDIQLRIDDEEARDDTFNHLYQFFARYYKDGDFISLRRYKSHGNDAYAIPYNGEEVKLHWANSDQYYIKTTENYASYIFLVDKDKGQSRVRFEIARADNEKDHIKEANGKKRMFVLAKKFIDVVGDDLVIRFEHRPLTASEKAAYPKNGQETLNADTESRIRSALNKKHNEWLAPLCKSCPTECDENRTLLRKHIDAYAAKNSFDYFIHKDLGGFLRRELDYYLKSEVLSVENLQLTNHPAVLKRALAQMQAIKRAGDQIIDFLAQLEDFQKQLWLKKKFVLETQYCITLDKVPESLYGDIVANKAQVAEWVELFAIDELESFAKKLPTDFLKANPFLVLDTQHFDKAFTDKLLAEISNDAPLDEQMNGLLVHGENFQALNLLQAQYRGRVQCVYIDPPYNTDASAIIYKNGYKNSSWLALMDDRLQLAKLLMPKTGVVCCAIDDEEAWRLRSLMQSVFENELGVVSVRSNPVGRKSTEQFSPNHEYGMFFGCENSAPAAIPKTEKQLARYPFSDEEGRYAWLTLIRQGSNDRRADRPKMFYPIFVTAKNELRIPKMVWNEAAREWDVKESKTKAEEVVYPMKKIGDTLVEGNWQRGWERINSSPAEYRVRRGDKNNGTHNGISIQFKTRMSEDATPGTWWGEEDYASSNFGARVMKDLFLENPFDFPKSLRLVEDCVVASSGGKQNVNVLDYFAGSGTTGHAVINLNRNDNGDRKYVLVELGKHFDAVLLPRIKKVIYSSEWKDGKPTSRVGVSQLVKYIRLESYEDTLDSLQIAAPSELLAQAEHQKFADDYLLRYCLDDGVTRDDRNATLVVKDFEKPGAHTLTVVREGVRGNAPADLAETFNFLLGLQVARRQVLDGILAISGKTADGDNALILWRDTKKTDAEKLNQWFAKHRKNLVDAPDKIYVNGDHMLNALQQEGDNWDAEMIEPVFQALMFEGGE